jgi:hypothetical protein
VDLCGNSIQFYLHAGRPIITGIQCPSEKIDVFHAISSIFDVVLTPTGGLAAAVSTEK